MASFINRKKEKILSVFTELGSRATEDSFIETFKEMYPAEWKLINERWQEEEYHTPQGKRHPMPDPNVYMKEMYRNHRNAVSKDLQI